MLTCARVLPTLIVERLVSPQAVLELAKSNTTFVFAYVQRVRVFNEGVTAVEVVLTWC